MVNRRGKISSNFGVTWKMRDKQAIKVSGAASLRRGCGFDSGAVAFLGGQHINVVPSLDYGGRQHANAVFSLSIKTKKKTRLLRSEILAFILALTPTNQQGSPVTAVCLLMSW